MRIDDSTRHQYQLSSLQARASRAFQLQQEIVTGSKVNKPSDDPGLYQLKDDLEQQLTGLQTDQRFLSTQVSRLDLYDSTVGSLAETLRQARTVAQRASTASTDPNAMAGLRAEMDGIIRTSLALVNQEVGGRYLFAGTRVDAPPFQAQGGNGPVTAVTYQGDEKFPGVPLPGGQSLQLGLDGRSLTQAGGADLFQTLIDLRNQLTGPTIDASTPLDRLSKLEDGMLQRRVEAGAASRYLSQIQSHLQADEQNTRESLASYTESDLPESITALLQNETAQQANYSVISRQAKLSLVDFLR